MKLHRMLISMLLCTLLFGLAVAAYADDPPKPTDDLLPEPTSTPLPKGSFDPVSIYEAEAVWDPSVASVTQMELDEDGESLVPVAPAEDGTAVPGENPAPGQIMLGRLNRETAEIFPDSSARANDLIVGIPGREVDESQVEVAASTLIKTEDFEGGLSGGWTRLDNNGAAGGNHLWAGASCFPLESSGSWSGWPARAGADGINPCGGADYPNNVDSWLIFGPFSLANAKSASLDFYFRIESESIVDHLFWGASINGTNFYGQQVSGTYISGPFQNGYNFASLDLTNVYQLGDLTGKSQVYIGFRFFSDFSIGARGPFIDSISLRRNNDARIVLTNENFDIVDFPNQAWESFDNDGPANGDYRWNDVNCFSHSDGWSMWPAGEGANAVNPCASQQYPNNAWSWLVHGPFSLENASEAWVDFYFRNQSEYTSDLVNDRFWWAVSVNGTNYWGFWIAGDSTGGPYGNLYNFMRFDLSNVFTLGDLRGSPQVWLAFIFDSNAVIQGQGPFVDDVRVVIERPVSTATYLPSLSKAPPPPQTKLFVKNETNGTVSYTVHNTPQGNITCNNIAAGTTKSCGTFTPGTYDVTVNTTQCGSNSGEVNFAPGNVTRVVRCVS